MMYKQKLQDLCQRRHWALPAYASTKDGADNNPRFWASVTVNGVTFDGPHEDACRTSKQAQNEAARVAFHHFSPFAVEEPADSPPPSRMSAASMAPSQPLGQSSCISSARAEVNDNSTRSDASKSHGLSIMDLDLNAREMQYLYKNKLQSYAQKRNMNLPVYDSVREGSLHAPHFKASVTVNGQKFESPQLSNTLKDAEHAAAKVALLTLSTDVNQEDEKGLYKSILLGMVQKEGLTPPIYHTVSSGPSHMPNFISTVELQGESFQGGIAKNKKQAESNAAKVAWTRFRECQQTRRPVVFSSTFQVVDIENELSSLPSTNSQLQKTCQANASPVKPDREEISEMQYLYKNKLQIYAQKRNMNLPVYDSVREGSLHAPHFKASVTVNGQKFESPQLSNTLKDAENAAAKVALLTLSTDVNQEDEKGLYKSILLGMVQKEGLTPPIYHTVSSGPSHMPNFISTVELQGESFQGGIAKNKKQAESNAAKVAWTRFRECQQTRRRGVFPSTFQVVDIENELSILPSTSSQFQKTCQANASPVKPDREELSGHAYDTNLSLSVPNDEDPATIPREGEIGSQGNLTECIHNHPKPDDSPSPPPPSAALYARSRDPSAQEPVPSEVETPSLFLPAEYLGQPSADGSSVCSDVHGDGSMPPNRVQIYPRKPDFQVPPGTKLLPCSDDKWVAVSVESPSGASFRGRSVELTSVRRRSVPAAERLRNPTTTRVR